VRGYRRDLNPAVMDHFSDAVVKNPIVGKKFKNPQVAEWNTKNLGKLPGLKFIRALWVCNVSHGPFDCRDRPAPDYGQ
jgi:hemoglobin